MPKEIKFAEETRRALERGVKIKALEEKYNCTTSQILLGYIIKKYFEK